MWHGVFTSAKEVDLNLFFKAFFSHMPMTGDDSIPAVGPYGLHRQLWPRIGRAMILGLFDRASYFPPIKIANFTAVRFASLFPR